MSDRSRIEPPNVQDGPLDEELDELDGVDGPDPRDAPSGGRPPSLEGLSVAGLTRRRAGWLVATFIAAWIVVVFARQVGDAAAKAAEADRARTANAALTADVSALQRELRLVQEPSFIAQQAHGQGLGGPRDHAFTLAQDAPPLSADAPGSASVRLGGDPTPPSPLESWLDLLFGSPGD